jgi:hypothetical protein
MNATSAELDAGHLSLVSHPKEIANLILAVAGRETKRTRELVAGWIDGIRRKFKKADRIGKSPAGFNHLE